MDVNDIVTLIGSLGFPIVACVGMFYLYNRTLKDCANTRTRKAGIWPSTPPSTFCFWPYC